MGERSCELETLCPPALQLDGKGLGLRGPAQTHGVPWGCGAGDRASRVPGHGAAGAWYIGSEPPARAVTLLGLGFLNVLLFAFRPCLAPWLFTRSESFC